VLTCGVLDGFGAYSVAEAISCPFYVEVFGLKVSTNESSYLTTGWFSLVLLFAEISFAARG
tara:strand:+ start:429 stop:611 length:183 start_codon:yes stop_codon:yes gene_type:complete